MSDETEESPDPGTPPKYDREDQGEDALHGLLLDPHRVKSDIRMLNHVFKGKGPPPHHIEEIWNRLMLHLRTDAVREIDPASGMMVINDRQGADISIKAAGMLGKFLKLFVDNEQAAMELVQKENQKVGDTFNIGCVGQIALGQDPVSPEDAKRQAQEVLARVRARTGGLKSPPGGENVVIDVKLEPPKSIGLDDL